MARMFAIVALGLIISGPAAQEESDPLEEMVADLESRPDETFPDYFKRQRVNIVPSLLGFMAGPVHADCFKITHWTRRGETKDGDTVIAIRCGNGSSYNMYVPHCVFQAKVATCSNRK